MSEAPWVEWEGAADEVITATCTSSPVDSFALAAACGFVVRAHAGSDAELRDGEILFNPEMRSQRQHMRIAHELGHFALARHRIADTEHGARWTGGAMLLPRRDFDRDLTRTAWSMSKLRELHINASATAIAVRTTQLRDAVAAIIDPRGRKKPWRVSSPWIAEPRVARISAWERELAQRAFDAGDEVRGDELCYAFPLLEGEPDEHRVIVVCELEQLSLRL
jgi:hypothetical protein